MIAYHDAGRLRGRSVLTRHSDFGAGPLDPPELLEQRSLASRVAATESHNEVVRAGHLQGIASVSTPDGLPIVEGVENLPGGRHRARH